MKKIFAFVAAVFFICIIAGSASAGGIKPQKSICLQLDPGPGLIALGIKKGNTFEYGSQKSTMYTVQGLFGFVPVCGTGFMNGDNFVLYLSSAMGGKNYTMQGLWDVVNETGEVYINETTDGAFDSVTHTLIQSDCDAV